LLLQIADRDVCKNFECIRHNRLCIRPQGQHWPSESEANRKSFIGLWT